MRAIVVDLASAAQSLATKTVNFRCRRDKRHASLGRKHRTGRCQLKLLCLIMSATLNRPRHLEAQPQQIRFERISLEQGLSQNSVNCILQDHQGFMWFGTQDGLNRYDGYSFTVYKHELLDSNSLSDNYVSTIYEDAATPNTLWIGTRGGGLNQFDRATERFTRFVNDPKKPHSLSHNNVQSMCADSAGTLWIGTWGGGLNRFDRGTEHFTRFVNDRRIFTLSVMVRSFPSVKTIPARSGLERMAADSINLILIVSNSGVIPRKRAFPMTQFMAS